MLSGMPFFLDRHDIRDATAEAIAAAHQQDLSVQDRHTCKALTAVSSARRDPGRSCTSIWWTRPG
jgi:hypothetical protein